MKEIVLSKQHLKNIEKYIRSFHSFLFMIVLTFKKVVMINQKIILEK